MSVIDKAASAVNKLPMTASSARLMGLAIAVIVAAGAWLVTSAMSAFEPFEVPACYWEGRGVPYEPGARDPKAYFASKLASARFDEDLEPMQSAMKVCAPASCKGAAQEAYRSALYQYVGGRMQQTLNADMESGEAGLVYALGRFSTQAHVDVVNGLRERVNSGAYKLTGRIQNEDAIRMLVYNPIDTFRPCRVKTGRTKWLW